MNYFFKSKRLSTCFSKGEEASLLNLAALKNELLVRVNVEIFKNSPGFS